MFSWSLGLSSYWFCYIAPILLFLILSCAKTKKHKNIEKSEETTNYAWIYVLPAQIPTQNSNSDNIAQTGTDTSKNTQKQQEITGSDNRDAQILSNETRGANHHKSKPKPTPQPKPKLPQQANKQPGKRTIYGLLFEEEGQKELPNKLILSDKHTTSIGTVVKLADKHQKFPANVRHRKTAYGYPLEESRQKSQHLDKKKIDKFCQPNFKHPPRKPQKPKEAPRPKEIPQAHGKKQPSPRTVYGMKSHSDQTKKTAATGSDKFGMMEDTLRRPIERPKTKKKKKKDSLVYL